MPDLLTHLRSVAPDRADVSILQPADPFLETAGEDLRRRIFLTESAEGGLNCLRPEFTIPICRHHIAANTGPGRYAYCGTVFRQERAGGSEFRQAGLEDLGGSDPVAADAACLADMMEALEMGGLADFTVTLGDQALFEMVVENLALPHPISARLQRNFGEPVRLTALLDELSNPEETADNGTDTAAQLARKGDLDALVAHVESVMAESGLSARSGRSPRAIAERAIARASDRRFRLDDDHAATLRAFLALQMPLPDAGDALAAFARAHGVEFGPALAAFTARVQRLAESGCATDRIVWRASFGRKLEYYSGLLFEAHAGDRQEAVAGGGRYDRLCGLLGSARPVPAVGFSISLDRLAEASQ